MSSKRFSLSPEKREILRSYHPDLSDLQVISFGTKAKDKNGLEIEETIHPDVHYRGEDDREYFVFYTPRILVLQKILKGLLMQEKRFDGWGLLNVVDAKPNKMPALTPNRADGEYPTSEKYEEDLRSAFGWGYWWFSTFEGTLKDRTAIDKCRNFRLRADMHCYLSSAIVKFGMYTHDLEIDKFFAISVDKDAKILFLRQTPLNRYRNVEEELHRIAVSPGSDEEEIRGIDRLLDSYMREIKPTASIERQIDYCFALNRANFYLSRLEHDLQNKDLATLVLMDALRRKINRQLLEFRFINERNATPFFDIKVDHCKIIIHTAKHTMAFFEKVEAIHFKTALEWSLDRKAQNISNKYSLEIISGPELRRLAEASNPSSLDDLLQQIDSEVQEIHVEIDKKKLEAKANMLNLGYKIVELVGKLVITNLESSAKIEMNSSEVEDFVKLSEANTGSSFKNNLAKTLKEISVSSDSIDTLVNTFRLFMECRHMEERIQQMQAKRDKLAEKREYLVDFINMVKLHIQIVRKRFEEDDSEGVLIEEKRTFEKRNGNELYAEYSVRTI